MHRINDEHLADRLGVKCQKCGERPPVWCVCTEPQRTVLGLTGLICEECVEEVRMLKRLS